MQNEGRGVAEVRKISVAVSRNGRRTDEVCAIRERQAGTVSLQESGGCEVTTRRRVSYRFQPKDLVVAFLLGVLIGVIIGLGV